MKHFSWDKIAELTPTPLLHMLKKRHHAYAKKHGIYKAQLHTAKLVNDATLRCSVFALSNDDLQDEAADAAGLCREAVSDGFGLEGAAFKAIQICKAHKYGFDLPEKNCGERVIETQWWLNKMRKLQRKEREEFAFKLKSINSYSSLDGDKQIRIAHARNADWASGMQIERGAKAFRLSDVIKTKENADKSRLFAMMKGMSDLQDYYDFDAVMITLTCPGTWRTDGTRIDTAIEHLREIVHKGNKWINRQDDDGNSKQIARVHALQPHKNGYPHMHIFAIGDAQELHDYCKLLGDLALEPCSDEAGAIDRRVDIKWEDKSKGRLANYALRYVTRNSFIDAEVDAKTSENNWYSLHGTRRVSWGGLPTKAAWEACRRDFGKALPKAVRKAAVAGRYAEWVIALGGICKTKAEYEIQSITEDKVSKYNDTYKSYIGMVIKGITIITKSGDWDLIPICSDVPYGKLNVIVQDIKNSTQQAAINEKNLDLQDMVEDFEGNLHAV